MNPTEAYHAVRLREGRVLADHVVRELPESGRHTRHAGEWRIRARGLRNLVRVLGREPLSILEVGCGNGWLTARLAEVGHQVTGVDTGSQELEQARRVFHHLPVRWVLGDPWSMELPEGSYDRIVFAASIQYFPAPRTLLHRCQRLLRAHGEVLIVDSPLYADDVMAREARERSEAYYADLGVPEMADHYHHHTRGSLLAAHPTRVEFLTAPWPIRILFPRHHPFPLVRIRM